MEIYLAFFLVAVVLFNPRPHPLYLHINEVIHANLQSNNVDQMFSTIDTDLFIWCKVECTLYHTLTHMHAHCIVSVHPTDFRLRFNTSVIVINCASEAGIMSDGKLFVCYDK